MSDATGMAVEANDTPCEIVFDGYDTNGDEWNRCVVHVELVFGDAYICEGYQPLGEYTPEVPA